MAKGIEFMDIRFLLFAGDDYYPEGGANDFKGAFESLDAAIEAHNPNEHKYDGGWANIFDLNTLKIVKTFNRGAWRDVENKERAIVVCVGGIDAIPSKILMELNSRFGEGGFVVIEPKEIKTHLKEGGLPLPKTTDFIIKNIPELLNEVKVVGQPQMPINAILKKRKW